MNRSPLLRLKTEFGSKEKLVEKISSKLSKKEGESESSFKKRLGKLSATKLLHLQARVNKEKTKK